MVQVGNLWVDSTEVSIESFAEYVNATNFRTAAEQSGGGLVYENGWEQKPGWTWRRPFGSDSDSRLPAVHITFDEAAGYCAWAGKRLPTDEEWQQVAYTESRRDAAPEFVRGETYPFPTGESPEGANCLNDCGPTPAVDVAARLNRGVGPAPVGSTKAGVNGLYDMGANVWEWTRIGDGAEQGTRGGSWWYGSGPMSRSHIARKPRDMAVVYIGFRCFKDA